MYLVHTFRVIYQYVLVCTQYIPVHDLFSESGTAFSSFLKGTSVYILTRSVYILGIPDPIASLHGPAGLPASNSCSSTHIEPIHTKAGLLTAAWHFCRQAWTWASAAAAAAGGSAAAAAGRSLLQLPPAGRLLLQPAGRRCRGGQRVGCRGSRRVGCSCRRLSRRLESVVA